MVNKSYSLVEPFAAIVDNTFERLSFDIDNNIDLCDQQENDEVSDDCIEFSDDFETHIL